MPNPTIHINSVSKLYVNVSPQKQSIGVHGNSAQMEVRRSPEDLEAPPPVVEILHRGWGTEVYGNQGGIVWGHFSLPVPLLVNDLSSIVSSIFFYFEAKQGAILRDVHVYDGEIKFKAFSAINKDGVFNRNLTDKINRFKVSRTLRYGLGLSLGFTLPRQTSPEPGPHEPAITLFAAGAEYV